MSNLKSQNHNLNLKSYIRYRAYQFSLSIIKFASRFPEKRVYWIIGDQLLRSATSIGANLIEAKSSSSRKDFINFFTHSLKSANESKVWLTLLRDTNKGDQDELQWLLKELIEIANVIAKSILTLKGK